MNAPPLIATCYYTAQRTIIVPYSAYLMVHAVFFVDSDDETFVSFHPKIP